MTFENPVPSNFDMKNVGIALNKAARILNTPFTLFVGGATSYGVYATNKHNIRMQKLKTQKALLQVQTYYASGKLPKPQAKEHVKLLDFEPSCLDLRTPEIIPLKKDKNVSFETSSRFGSITTSVFNKKQDVEAENSECVSYGFSENYEQKNYSRSKPQEVFCIVEANPFSVSPKEERQLIAEAFIFFLVTLATTFSVITIYNLFFPEKESDFDKKQIEKDESDLLQKNISEILVKLTTLEAKTEIIKNETQKLSSEIAVLKQEYKK